MVYALSAIAILSFLLWSHHMFTTGLPAAGILFFMYATMLIAVPTGVKVFNWLATMWKGAISLEAPMLFALGFLFLFTLGGFTGLVLAIQPIDVQFQDTYYVVAHFHYVVVKCIRGGEKAPAKPWEGGSTLEWTLPSPAPYHTFETPPVVQ